MRNLSESARVWPVLVKKKLISSGKMAKMARRIMRPARVKASGPSCMIVIAETR